MSAGHSSSFSRYLTLSLGVHSLLTLGMLQVMTTAPDLDSPTPTPVSVALTVPALATLSPHLEQKQQLHPPTDVIDRTQTAVQPVTPAPATIPLPTANAAWPVLANASVPLPHRTPPQRHMPVKRLSAPAVTTSAAAPQALQSKRTPIRQPSHVQSVRAISSPSTPPQRTAPTATQAAVQTSRVAPASSTAASESALDINRQRRLARRQATGTPFPQFIYQPKPHYPLIARRRGWQGTVTLTIEMLSDGTVGIIKVATSSGYPALDSAAQKAVRKWRHRPLQRNGSPITRQANLPIHFRLD